MRKFKEIKLESGRIVPDPKQKPTRDELVDWAQSKFGYSEKKAVSWANGWLSSSSERGK